MTQTDRLCTRGRPTVGVLVGYQVYYEGKLNPFLSPIFRGILSAAHDRGCNLLIACGVSHYMTHPPVRPAWPVPAPDVDFVPVGPWNTDGLIVVLPFSSDERSRYIQTLIAEGHPVVFVTRSEQGPAVVVDSEDGIRRAVAHLLAHGHRRVAFIAGQPDDPGDSALRLQAFRSAMAKYELEFDPRLVVYGSHNYSDGRRAMAELLARGDPFSAVLASNDESAMGAMQALREAGLRVPQDVALVGFDDHVEAKAQSPPLTTVRYPLFESGYQALELLLRRIEGRAGGSEIVRLPARLIVRRSCGCRPGARLVAGLEALSQAVSTDVEPWEQVVNDMALEVLAETLHLSSEQVQQFCQRLVSAFRESLHTSDAAPFLLALEETLQCVEAADDYLYAWHEALSALGERAAQLLEGYPEGAHGYMQNMLNQALAVVGEGMQRQYILERTRQLDVIRRLGAMTAHFLSARDQAEIIEILAQQAQELGIGPTAVAFYEPEGEDNVAWSSLYAGRGAHAQSMRFPTRFFPPARLYLQDAPFHLALLPLVDQGVEGFVALNASDIAGLEPGAAMVWQLASALRSQHMYYEAVRGRRLAEEANRLKSRFLSTVSHELRIPLSLIIEQSRLLLERLAQSAHSPYREDLERICASAQHLDSLICDVLDLARSEVGQLKLNYAALDLAEVLEVPISVGERLARDKGLDWSVDLPGRSLRELPKVWGDCTRLRQVVLNLVHNAVKFTERGKVCLSVEPGKHTVKIAVSDTGLGIPLEEQAVIFDEFRQSERTTARGYGGLGLGLAICKRLVEMHGGEIGVYSSGLEGAGSTFYFTLPVIEDVEQLDGELAALASPEQRVLLLAKRAAGGEILRDHLLRQGFNVEPLWVDEVSEWPVQRPITPPGAVVLDLNVASERGWEMLKILRENAPTRDVPVLFYFLAQEQDSGSVFELDYLTKPVDSIELARALERQGLLGEGKQGAENLILIVDDEPAILEMHTRIIQDQLPGSRILQARNGRQALEIVREALPDIVLLDLMMPEMDGFRVLEAMQQDVVSRHIPVIVLTGKVLSEEDMAHLNQGVTSVLSKGLFSVQEVLAHVEAALSRSQRLGSETRRLVRKAMAYLHEHYTEPVSLKDAADYVGVSKEYLARCFRRETGMTLVNYLNRYRVQQAKRLLEAGQASVTDVALQVGFSSAAYFSRVFSREVGSRPPRIARRTRAERAGLDNGARSGRVAAPVSILASEWLITCKKGLRLCMTGALCCGTL